MTRPRSAPRPTRPSGRAHTVPNPTGPDQAQLERGGGPFVPAAQRIERGTILAVDAAHHTYRVVLNNGSVLNGVARIRSSPGDVSLLPAQIPVMVAHGLGEPYIIGVLPFQGRGAADEDPDNFTGTDGHGGQDPVLAPDFGTDARTPGDPQDLIPGDTVLRSVDGAAVGALHGKVAVLRGSPLAQIRAFGLDDAVEIIAGKLRTVTWVGESRYTNDDGQTNFSWRGGASQLTETGPDEGAYTVRLDVGSTGDLFNFEITTPAGQSLFRFHVDALGHLSLTTRGGWDWTSGAERTAVHPTRIQGERAVEVAGEERIDVAGDATHDYRAGHYTTVGGNSELVVDNNFIGDVAETYDMHARHVLLWAHESSTRTAVTGDVLDRVQTGDYLAAVDAGDWSVDVAVGDATVRPRAGTFKVDTANADKIELGTNPTLHAALYENLATQLDFLVADYNAFKELVLSHVHPETGAATQPSPELATVEPYEADWSSARALVVKLL